MIAKIQKWGNSLGVRIPRGVAADVRVREGTSVNLHVEQGRLVIKPIKPKRESLHSLLALVTPGNLHAEVETGPAVGREAW